VRVLRPQARLPSRAAAGDTARRSWAYNLECNVFVEDEGFGRDATEQFEEDLLLSVRLPRPSRFGVTDSVADAFAAAMESLYALGL
jgi:hypothetical protein